MTTHNPHKPRQSVGDPSLPREDHFECLPGCGLCCSYRVLLTNTDLLRIQTLGALSARPLTWFEERDNDQALRRDTGFCVFLGPNQSCTVYEQRPNHCRSYPFLQTAYSESEIDVDLSCPGLGHGTIIPERQISTSNESVSEAQTRFAGIHAVEGLLRAHHRFVTPAILASVTRRAIGKLSSVWSSDLILSLRVSQALALGVNVDSEAQAADLWAGLQWTPVYRETLHADTAWIDRHFSKPRWNTRLFDKHVTLYRFWIAAGIFYQEERSKPPDETALSNITPITWLPEALQVRQAYLNRWCKRQLLIRLSANVAIARLIQGDHLATCTLKFLTDIDQRLAVLAPALAWMRGKQTVDRAIALEAMRGSDGLLRAWCESARMGLSNL